MLSVYIAAPLSSMGDDCQHSVVGLHIRKWYYTCQLLPSLYSWWVSGWIVKFRTLRDYIKSCQMTPQKGHGCVVGLIWPIFACQLQLWWLDASQESKILTILPALCAMTLIGYQYDNKFSVDSARLCASVYGVLHHRNWQTCLHIVSCWSSSSLFCNPLWLNYTAN